MTANQDEASTPVYEVHGPRATIRLNRPRHHNRLQPEDLVALMALFDQVEADPAVRVLVLTGTGRSFSSGYDLGSIAKRQASGQQQIAGTSFEAVTNRLEELSVPTICRLNGGVYGGATDLALACDFRIAADTVEMFMPAARLGLHYYKDGIKRYVSRLGADNARMLFLTARKINAAEMLRIGYLTAVAPADRLDAEVNSLADVIGANAPNAMAGMKRTINEFARGELDEAAADARHRASMQSDEVKEGVAAFAEKRAPKFTGLKTKA
jgi:enoyl-CoA hydratase